MKLKKTMVMGMTAVMISINSISNVFAERIVLKDVSGDLSISNSYHYSTSPADKNQKVVFKIGSKTVKVNDTVKEIDEAPFIKDGTTLLPLRAVSDTLNVFGNSSQVNWNSALKKAVVNYMDKEIIFTQDNKNYTIDGKIYSMQGTAPVIQNGRIFIPLRTLIDAMELNIEWNEALKEVTIY